MFTLTSVIIYRKVAKKNQEESVRTCSRRAVGSGFTAKEPKGRDSQRLRREHLQTLQTLHPVPSTSDLQPPTSNLQLSQQSPRVLESRLLTFLHLSERRSVPLHILPFWQRLYYRSARAREVLPTTHLFASRKISIFNRPPAVFLFSELLVEVLFFAFKLFYSSFVLRLPVLDECSFCTFFRTQICAPV